MRKQLRRQTTRPRAKMKSKSASRSSPRQEGVLKLLSEDHRKVERLFQEFEKMRDGRGKQPLAEQIIEELAIHTTLEEEIFYPACRETGMADDLLDEAQVEHDAAKTMIADLQNCMPGDPFYDAKVKVLGEYIRHHIQEEEKQLFPKVKKAGLDLEDLAEEMRERKQELMADAESGRLEPPQPRVLHAGMGSGGRQRQPQRGHMEYEYMPRQQQHRLRGMENRFGQENGRRWRNEDRY